MKSAGPASRVLLRKAAYPVLRAAVYLLFVVYRILLLLRRPMVPYLRDHAMRRSKAEATLMKGGVSILIPEHRTPDLLSECLGSVLVACQNLREPWEIIVVVNGAEESRYVELRNRFKNVRWLLFPRAMGFDGAIRAGLPATTYAWVYLLNSDMVLNSDALQALLPWRGPRVFAIASQIFFQDTQRRREETGWTRMVTRGGMIEFWDELPEYPDSVRGTIYAGGGASLFQKLLLQRLVRRKPAYPTGYWEDIEWGVVAWKKGYASLFCPNSRVTHRHRATYSQIYSEDELTTILRINQCRFQLRNPMPGRADWDFLRSAAAGAFVAAVKGPSLLSSIAHRFASLLFPWDAAILEHAHLAFFQKPPANLGDNPTVLIVTPYCIFPPTHGGAVRITRLLEELRSAYHFILLSDEGESYEAASLKYLPLLAALHPISGRREKSATGSPRIARIKSHSHERLKDWLDWLIAFWKAALVQIEFIECAGLLSGRPTRAPWVLTLHEVWLSGSKNSDSPDDFESRLIRRYSAVTVCCQEDASLLPDTRARVVPNGMRSETVAYLPSPPEPILLFMGSLRYGPNMTGIRIFLRSVYPPLKHRIPDLELWILGGIEARQSAAPLEEFQQEGVTVVDYVEDIESWLSRCALTINPLLEIRGTCIKILDSLSAGRLCISTRQGSRGFAQYRLPQLIIVETIGDFEPLLSDLLTNVEKRRSLEQLKDEDRKKLTWQRSADIQSGLYRELLEEANPRADATRLPFWSS